MRGFTSRDHAQDLWNSCVELRDQVAQHLSPSQILEAQKLARDWRPNAMTDWESSKPSATPSTSVCDETQTHVPARHRDNSGLSFVAVDVETASASRASICQIGIVTVVDGTIADSWKSLINPGVPFDASNISVHGLTEDAVRDAPDQSGEPLLDQPLDVRLGSVELHRNRHRHEPA